MLQSTAVLGAIAGLFRAMVKGLALSGSPLLRRVVLFVTKNVFLRQRLSVAVFSLFQNIRDMGAGRATRHEPEQVTECWVTLYTGKPKLSPPKYVIFRFFPKSLDITIVFC